MTIWLLALVLTAIACATLLSGGGVLPNTQELNPITKENSAAAREDLNKILGQ